MGRHALSDPALPSAATAGEIVAADQGPQVSTEAAFNQRREQAIAKFGDGLPSWSMEHYESEIRRELGRSAESFLQAGRMLLVARECTTHGEWGGMLQRLNLGSDTALRMMAWAKHCSALPNPARVRDLTQAAGTIGKMVELCQLPPEQFQELAEGQTGELALDDVARMTRDELRAAVREARADIEAKDSRSQDRERRIERLEKELRKARGERARATPDQVSTKLRDRVQIAAQQLRCDIVARSDGDDVSSLSQAIHELRAHAAEQGDASAHDVYLGGLIGELLTELRVLRDQHCLPIVRDHGDPAWMTGN